MPREVIDLPQLPRRDPDSHKGTFGRVLLVAGSSGMCGAAILTARAALRSGSGLVTVALPSSLSNALSTAAPEATQLLLPDPGDADVEAALDRALAPELLATFDAAGIGPGLGTTALSRKVLEALLDRLDSPQVIDADALNLIADGPGIAPLARRVWTPHPGELERLTGERPRSDEERRSAARRFVEKRGGVIALKGRGTVVDDGTRVAINTTGNPGMATAGSGDVLTGIIASFLGQGLSTFDAARLGVHLHGLAGDIAVRHSGEPSLIASDLVDCLPAAIATCRDPT